MKHSIFILYTFVIYSLLLSQTDYWVKTNAPTGIKIQKMAINSSDHIFFTSEDSAIFRSINNGIDWERKSNGLPFPYFYGLLITPDSHLFAGSWGVFHSSNNGESWNATGTLNAAVFCLAFKSPNFIFSGTGGGIYRSTDNGLYWEFKSNGITDSTSADIWDIAVNNNGDIYIAARSRGIYFSSNNGDSWKSINEGILNPDIHTITVDDSDFLYTANYGEIFKSKNNGASWTKTNFESTQIVTKILFDSQSEYLFAATSADGVYYSSNYGDSWIHIDTGMDNKSIVDLAIDSEGLIYAASDEGGIYKSAGRVTAIYDIVASIRSNSILAQNYPNPFNPSTTISYQLPVASKVDLTIYNILGQRVWQEQIDNQTAGPHEINVDLSNHASGIYFYRLEAGGFTQTKKMVLLK